MNESANEPRASAIRTIAIIGAGRAGRGFAIECAAAGYRVILEDVMPANLRRAQEQYAELTGNQSTGTLELASTIESAVREADLAVDFVPDELESKLEIFCLIDRMAPPKTSILTPSEALSITDLASCTYRGDRCFAVRGGFPESTSLLLLLPATASREALKSIYKFLESLGRTVLQQVDVDEPMLTRNLQ